MQERSEDQREVFDAESSRWLGIRSSTGSVFAFLAEHRIFRQPQRSTMSRKALGERLDLPMSAPLPPRPRPTRMARMGVSCAPARSDRYRALLTSGGGG